MKGRLYRDRENGIFMGVCAGVAEAFDVRTLGVRIIAVIALLVAFWPTVLAYLVAGWLLPDRPLSYRGRGRESRFWREARHEHETWR